MDGGPLNFINVEQMWKKISTEGRVAQVLKFYLHLILINNLFRTFVKSEKKLL